MSRFYRSKTRTQIRNARRWMTRVRTETVARNPTSLSKRAAGTLIFVSTVAFVLDLFSGDALAWGPGVHIVKGTFILDNLHLILPVIAKLLKAFPRDFLYGCISADFFIGKGHRRRDDHCHNWSIGLKMLANADSPATEAFCYGYLAHLAADIVAHNFYIPNQLYLTSSTKRFGHVYWEFRSDSKVDSAYWELARQIVASHNGQNDASLKKAVRQKIFSFQAKKRVYVRMLNLTDLERWQRACKFVERNSRWRLPEDYMQSLQSLSISLALDFLRDPENSVCLDYDPVGTRNITRAKALRRTTKRTTGAKPAKGIFEIPEELARVCSSDLAVSAGEVHLRKLRSLSSH